MERTPILIIGSGISGLTLALKIAPHCPVILSSKSTLYSSNSTLAQGGVASVTLPSDSFENHIQDTLRAGAGLCHKPAVTSIITQAPQRIQDLIKWGVKFDTSENKKLSLNREGGHSRRRILHIEDQTGAYIHNQLMKKVFENKNITTLDNHFAVELLTTHTEKETLCGGALFYDQNQKTFQEILSPYTILATGGSGQVYQNTSNWQGATGDGLALAHKAGAHLENLEFTQFHPTTLHTSSSPHILISEALRGEGGVLINQRGEAFMSKYHPLKDLAPRDIVSRAIIQELQITPPQIFLDISHKPLSFLKKRFPFIYRKCLEHHLDLSKEPIPIIPSAHYQCGGIKVNLSGVTSIKQLYAIGEVAHTGLHGANRLASNSLLECLSTAHSCSTHILKSIQQKKYAPPSSQLIKPPTSSFSLSEFKENPPQKFFLTHTKKQLQKIMWDHVGIIRTKKGLTLAQSLISQIEERIKSFSYDFHNHKYFVELEELKNLTLTARLITQCALQRKESRGIHYVLDFPQKKRNLENSLL